MAALFARSACSDWGRGSANSLRTGACVRREDHASAGADTTRVSVAGNRGHRNRAVLSFIHKSTASIYSRDGQIAIVACSRARSLANDVRPTLCILEWQNNQMEMNAARMEN